MKVFYAVEFQKKKIKLKPLPHNMGSNIILRKICVEVDREKKKRSKDIEDLIK